MTDHRELARTLFNSVWDLLDRTDRGPADDDRMIHMAHASRYHWGEVGTAQNLIRGEWQCARVYAVLGRSEPALWHGQRALALCKEHGVLVGLIGAARDGVRSGDGLVGEAKVEVGHVDKANEVSIADPEDRDHLKKDLASVLR
ncbi:hypothetical protein [Alloactinosynnema sp. L-07]|uniref:hypothetical protein n=1 Tax=Alloactinosynnema sp. L-07 TaxID=1653480 RepID=UPI00065EF066|nr:hypothetical protein [Alloactinosynnema sp. L-07]CRK55605.1 hypothetical protein [Alloactinosynnema sp. L-07]